MKSIDKKTIILISVLLAIATLVIVISQSFLDKNGGNKFGNIDAPTTKATEKTTETVSKDTTIPETTKTVETETESSSSVDLTEPNESTVENDETNTETSNETTTEPEKEAVQYSIYNTYYFGNRELEISTSGKYVLSDRNTGANFTGGIRNVSNGDNVPIKNRKLKKLGLNPKTINKENLFYVQLEYDKHEFVKNEQSVVCYFNKNAQLKKDSFNVLIYYNEDGTTNVYDLNGDIVNTDFNNFYF